VYNKRELIWAITAKTNETEFVLVAEKQQRERQQKQQQQKNLTNDSSSMSGTTGNAFDFVASQALDCMRSELIIRVTDAELTRKVPAPSVRLTVCGKTNKSNKQKKTGIERFS